MGNTNTNFHDKNRIKKFTEAISCNPSGMPGRVVRLSRMLAAAALLIPATGWAADDDLQMELDEVSVTATRMERKTSEVTASVSVITNKQIEESKQFNVKDVLAGTPGVLIEATNQGYDSRLIIRGAGLKAPYGVREIMVLRDGVPVTDPDSFTRLDMIDTQLIDRVEVVKGPNSTLWGANAAGGVINIISKNPLEQNGVNMRMAFGEHDTSNYHLSFADNQAEKLYYSGSVSHRETSNSWRRWNQFSTTQVSIQPNLLLEDGSTLENMLSFSQADLQLPGNLDEAMFEEYLQTGEANATDGTWQYSGRYSTSYFFSSKLTKTIGSVEFIPLIYANIWEHHHPVTGRINDADTAIGGMDLQLNYRHTVSGMEATITGGVTGRFDSQETDYFKYADFATIPGPSGRIKEVLSDEAGSLLEMQSKDTQLYGLYIQETIRPNEKIIVDIGARYDKVKFDISSINWGDYDWSKGKYLDYAESTTTSVEKSYEAISPRIGMSYELTKAFHAFISASSGIQTPTESEISDNPDLELVKVQSYEVGFKGRGKNWSLDSAVYYSPVKNEVAKVLQDGVTEYVNAGETKKIGVELAASMELFSHLTLAGSYTYSDFTYDEFSEPVGFGPAAVNMDRSGNQLPYIPQHQYSISAHFRHPSGFKCNIQTHTWGEYYMDNANTEQYDGYDFITNAMVGFEHGGFDYAVNIENLFDKQYANEVTKDTSGNKSFTPAAPRTIIAKISLKF